MPLPDIKMLQKEINNLEKNIEDVTVTYQDYIILAFNLL